MKRQERPIHNYNYPITTPPDPEQFSKHHRTAVSGVSAALRMRELYYPGCLRAKCLSSGLIYLSAASHHHSRKAVHRVNQVGFQQLHSVHETQSAVQAYNCGSRKEPPISSTSVGAGGPTVCRRHATNEQQPHAWCDASSYYNA